MTDPRVIALVREIFEQRIAFNALMGLRLERLADGDVAMSFAAAPALVGNFQRDMLHGGVIAAALDATGGLVAFSSWMAGRAYPEVEASWSDFFGRLATIDMRVDYLRPGLGKRFVVSGQVMRPGRTVSVARLEMHDDTGVHIAHGVCTFITA